MGSNNEKSRPEKYNSGGGGLNIMSPSQADGGFSCDCGKSFTLKSSLNRHKKERCGNNRTNCLYCEATFTTYQGVRQHERKMHPVEYNKQLLSLGKDKPSSREMMERIASVEAKCRGHIYATIVAETGLTHHQVRRLRERQDYRPILEEVKANLTCMKIVDSPVPEPPRTRSRTAASATTTASGCQVDGTDKAAVQNCNSCRKSSVLLSSPAHSKESVSTKTAPEKAVGKTSRFPPARSQQQASVAQPYGAKSKYTRKRVVAESAIGSRHTRSDDESIVVSNTSGNIKTPCIASSNVGSCSTYSNLTGCSSYSQVSKNLDTSSLTLDTSKSKCDDAVTCPGPNIWDRSTSTPSPTIEAPHSASGTDDVANVYVAYLTSLLDGDISTAARHGMVELVKAALRKNDHLFLETLNSWLEDATSGLKHRRGKGKRKPVNAPKHYGQIATGSGKRAAGYKKFQDLYIRNRRGLAEVVLSGKGERDSGLLPPVERVERFYGDILESPSPADDEPFRPKRCEKFDSDKVLVTVEEVEAARKGWSISAPGVDQVSVASVKTMSAQVLTILYNIILFRCVTPRSWCLLRTTLVPKSGDLQDPANWRPITISSALQRLLHRVLASRLSKHATLSSSQRGFVEIDGTLANSFILDTYIRERRHSRKAYNVVSLDVQKAFDTVSHHSLIRALSRFEVPAYLTNYLINTLNATTSIKVGAVSTRQIELKRGVRQGDPLSPVLFSLVVDEILDKVNEKYQGGTLPNNERCAVMAFADDLVLLSDQESEVPEMLKDVSDFLKKRGMTINPTKSKAIVGRVVRRAPVVLVGSTFNIDSRKIPNIDVLDTFKYLGHDFGNQGIGKPSLYNMTKWLKNVKLAPLKPEQKADLIRRYVIPRLLYGLQTPKVTSQALREADRSIRRTVKDCLHLNIHTPNASIHASVRDGGLGFMELRGAIPRIFLGRLNRLLEKGDSVVKAVLMSNHVQKLMATLSNLAGDVPESSKWRDMIARGPLTKGVQQASEDSASRQWIMNKPTGWSGRDYVRAVQLRTANLPTAAIPSNPVGMRRCRHGCGVDETIAHVLQMCPLTHDVRIKRHDNVVKHVARHCRSRGWTVEEEPHLRASSGQLFKPDLAVHSSNRVIVADVQVCWDSENLGIGYERKRAKYDVAPFREAAFRAWPGKELVFCPVILGARGIWPRLNNDRSGALAIPPAVRNACVNSVLRWGSTIHKQFMRSVFAKTVDPRPYVR